MGRYLLVVIGFVFMFAHMTGRACPYCVLPNHLHESVWSPHVTVVVGKVVEVRENQARVKVTESLKGELKVGSSDWYEKRWCDEAVMGVEVLAFGRGGISAEMDGGVTSISLLQEVRWLMARDFSPEDAETAAAYLTAASVVLHHSGVAYFKEHPLKTQEALIKRIAVLEEQVLIQGRTLYLDDRYRFGLTALMKMPSYLSREAAVRILDEFWLLSGKKRDLNEVAWILQKVQTVVASAYRERDESLKALIGDMLRSAEGQALSWLSQCLIISEALTVAEIRQIRFLPEDEAWIKEALILCSRLYFFMGDNTISDSLAKEATALQAKSSADDLLTSLKLASAAGEKWTKTTHPWANATPADVGWFRNSTLSDSKAWDQVKLEKTKNLKSGEAQIALVIIGLLLLIAIGLGIRKSRSTRAAHRL